MTNLFLFPQYSVNLFVVSFLTDKDKGSRMCSRRDCLAYQSAALVDVN